MTILSKNLLLKEEGAWLDHFPHATPASFTTYSQLNNNYNYWYSSKNCYNWDDGLVGADSGLSSHRIFPSHAQNFLEFWKRPADRAIIPQVNLQGRIESVL